MAFTETDKEPLRCSLGTLHAVKDVIAERERQKTVEGWTENHDDTHYDDSLAQAAACYAMPDGARHFVQRGNNRGAYYVPTLWPISWAGGWWKPKGRRRDLVRAAALILAEIERLDRAGDFERGGGLRWPIDRS